MYFTFNENNSEYYGELLYIKDEESLYYNPWNTNVGVSVMCGNYTSLDTICETEMAVQISGLNSKYVWIPKKLEMPKAKKGGLIAHLDDPPIRGTGVDYNRSWLTYFDEDSNCICIGDPIIEADDDCLEFANKIIAVLREAQLISILAQIKEV